MKHEKTTSLLSLLVFALFALCLLLTVLTGARAYRQTVELTQESSDSRTKIQYLSARIRQSQETALEDFGGCEALAFREVIDGECYVTYIYCFDGWLRELFCLEGAGLSPEDGEKVIPAEEMELSLNEGLLTVSIDGEMLCSAIRRGGTP